MRVLPVVCENGAKTMIVIIRWLIKCPLEHQEERCQVNIQDI